MMNFCIDCQRWGPNCRCDEIARKRAPISNAEKIIRDIRVEGKMAMVCPNGDEILFESVVSLIVRKLSDANLLRTARQRAAGGEEGGG